MAKGISQHDLVNRDWVAKRYDIPGDRYGLFATFRGDPSDGLPGVKGIGEKGAALIARHYESAEAAIQGAIDGHEHLSQSLRKKIIEGQKYLSFAPKLVACATDVPLPKINIDLPKRPISPQEYTRRQFLNLRKLENNHITTHQIFSQIDNPPQYSSPRLKRTYNDYRHQS